MTTTAARLLALPFAAVAFALRAAVDWWIVPLTWRLDPGPVAFAVFLLSGAAALGLPLLGYLLLTRRARRRPATWSVGAGRFVAGAAPRYAGPWTVVAGWVCGAALYTERVPGTDRVRIAGYGVFEWVTVAAVVVLVALLVLTLALGRPRLELSPDGGELLRVGRPQRFGWDDLTPGVPPGPARDLLVVERPGRPVQLPAGRLQVDPAFLAQTIRFYTDHPARRPAIGTAAGLAELRAAAPGG